MTRDFLFTTWEGGGNVPPTLGAVRRLVERGHRVRVLTDDAMQAGVTAMGASFVPWRRAPNRTDRTRESDMLRDWEAEGEGGGLIRVLERICIGPAAAYAADTMEELHRHPADVIVNCDLLFGPMIAAEATATKLAMLAPNISLFHPIPGVPPVGPGMPPPATPEEHAQAEAVRAWFANAMAAQLPVLNAARAAFGLRPVTDAFDQPAQAERALLATSRALQCHSDDPWDRLGDDWTRRGRTNYRPGCTDGGLRHVRVRHRRGAQPHGTSATTRTLDRLAVSRWT